ncbi:hypothetical protein TcCL_Unassigned03146 [Trypanosoma cruzi]|nr:hypothetical protein TcCL_Unassigned03146 [Trypanosoma cruzi]
MAFRDWPTRHLNGRKPLLPCAKRIGLLLHRCVKLSFFTLSTWLDIRRGILRAAKRHIPRGSRERPKTNMDTRNVASQGRRRSSIQGTHIASPGDSLLRAELIQKREERNQALRRCFAMLLEARVEKLGASPSPSWRDLRGVAAPHPHPLEAVVLRTDLRTAFALCLGNRQICSSVILCGFTCHTALYCCCCCTPHSIAR